MQMPALGIVCESCHWGNVPFTSSDSGVQPLMLPHTVPEIKHVEMAMQIGWAEHFKCLVPVVD